MPYFRPGIEPSQNLSNTAQILAANTKQIVSVSSYLAQHEPGTSSSNFAKWLARPEFFSPPGPLGLNVTSLIPTICEYTVVFQWLA